MAVKTVQERVAECIAMASAGDTDALTLMTETRADLGGDAAGHLEREVYRLLRDAGALAPA